MGFLGDVSVELDQFSCFDFDSVISGQEKISVKGSVLL